MIIVKIGGGSQINIAGIIEDLAAIDEPYIIVHGANALRDKLAEDLGQPKQVLTSVKGYTSVYSDEKLLDVMMMAYAGLRNKRIVEQCQQHGHQCRRPYRSRRQNGSGNPQQGHPRLSEQKIENCPRFFRQTRDGECGPFATAAGQRVRPGFDGSDYR